jgi:hypothetical protein
MTIVAVNGGGNTPQGVQLERCFVKSWSTSGDADGTNDSFIFADYRPTESLAVDPTNPNVDLRPMETPGPDDNVGLPAVQMDDGLLVPPSTLAEFPSLAAMWMEPQTPLAIPSRSLLPSVSIPRRTRGPTSCTKMCLCRRSKPGPQ